MIIYADLSFYFFDNKSFTEKRKNFLHCSESCKNRPMKRIKRKHLTLEFASHANCRQNKDMEFKHMLKGLAMSETA